MPLNSEAPNQSSPAASVSCKAVDDPIPGRRLPVEAPQGEGGFASSALGLLAWSPVSTVVVPKHFVGPPGMGHGGYVAGIFARHVDGAVQVTLRRATPVGVDLTIEVSDDGTVVLSHDGELVAEAEPAVLDLDVPPVPGIDAARAAEAGSPSYWNEIGVHPICLGCGLARDDDEGLGIAVGPLEVDGQEQVAAVWRPTPAMAAADGTVDPQWVLAALDCPGAMAFIARGTFAGLLGRITFEQTAPAHVGVDHVVTGWQIDRDGRKLFAGTALATADGTVLARARATWFERT